MYNDRFLKSLVENTPRKTYKVGSMGICIEKVHAFKKKGLASYDSETDSMAVGTGIFEVKDSQPYKDTKDFGNFEWIKAIISMSIGNELKKLRIIIYKDGQLTFESLSEGGIDFLEKYTRCIYLFLEGMKLDNLSGAKTIRQTTLIEGL